MAEHLVEERTANYYYTVTGNQRQGLTLLAVTPGLIDDKQHHFANNLMDDTNLKDNTFRNALPVGHQVSGYEIQLVLGQSGSCITYLALNRLQNLLAVEEFFPSQLATRSSDNTVGPASNNLKAAYYESLKIFIAETFTLAELHQASIPHVYPVLELNNTAYRVMDYRRGKSLKNVYSAGDIGKEINIHDVLMPLLDAVECIHLAGLVHGDIRPENIILCKKGPPLLLGFSSSQPTLSIDNEAGPWADIYALAACFYPAIAPAVAGQVTPDVRSRIRALAADNSDPLKPAVELGGDRYSRPFLAAIDRALSFLPEKRLQSIAEWRALLNIEEACVEVEPPRPSVPAESSSATPVSDSIDPQSSSLAPEEAEAAELPKWDGAAELAEFDAKIFAAQPSPMREEAGRAAKRALAKARAAAEEAAIEHARIDEESAARRKSRRRRFAAALFIVALIGADSVVYRLLDKSSGRPTNELPQSAATVGSTNKASSAFDIEQLLSFLDNTPCISAAAVINDDAIHLTGYSAQASATSDLITAIKQKAGSHRIQNGIVDVSADKCTLLETYRSAWRSNQGSKHGATLSSRNSGNVFRHEERLIIDLTTSNYPSYLYIDFFLQDGTVLHMIPSPFNQDNQAPARYKAAIGDLGDWVAAPPFGEEMVVMLSSSVPLFNNERPEHEDAKIYLGALSRELERASKIPDTRIGASFLLITTKPIE